MKITDIKYDNKLLKDYKPIVECHINNNKPDKIAIMFDYSQDPTHLILAVARINRLMAFT